jgi:thiol-disulfide isomerase/thioredoxin
MSQFFYGSYASLWLLVIVESVLLLMLYRHFGLMALGTADGVQRDGLPVGAEAPALTGILSDGTTTDWAPKSRLTTLLFFAAPDCEPCARMVPYLNELARRDDLQVIAMASGPRQIAERMAEKFSPLFTSIADDGSGAFQEYRVRVTPFAFVVGEDGRIRAKGLSSDPYRLRDLLHQGGSEEASRSVRPPEENSPATVRAIELLATTNGKSLKGPLSGGDSAVDDPVRSSRLGSGPRER